MIQIFKSVLPICLLLVCLKQAAAVPYLVEYSGRVSSGGLPFTGTGSFRFALVDVLGTTTYWSNDGTSAAGSKPASSVSAEVDDGFYSVYLGDSTVTNMTAIDESVFDNDNLYLRVWFDDGTNGSQLLTPDQRVASTAFAARAAKADKVADGAITESMLSAELLNKLLSAAARSAPSGMVTVSSGKFNMGEEDGGYDRTPIREITLSQFFVETHEVSKDTWDSIYSWATFNGYDFDNAGSATDSTHPVCQLNWYDIIKWCNARSEQEGLSPVYYAWQVPHHYIPDWAGGLATRLRGLDRRRLPTTHRGRMGDGRARGKLLPRSILGVTPLMVAMLTTTAVVTTTRVVASPLTTLSATTMVAKLQPVTIGPTDMVSTTLSVMSQNGSSTSTTWAGTGTRVLPWTDPSRPRCWYLPCDPRRFLG